MEKYIIRVNGTEYEVEVEKAGGSQVGGVIQDRPAEAKPAAKAAAAESAGQKVTAGTAGKVWKVTAEEGDSVKRGDSIVVLEAMKMEIPVVAPCDGTVGKLLVNEGDSVDMGQAVAIVA